MAHRFLNHLFREWDMTLRGDEWVEYLRCLDIPRPKVETLIQELGECDCCDRHQTHCPPCLTQTYPETPVADKTPLSHKPDTCKGVCGCHCRSHARKLCLAYS